MRMLTIVSTGLLLAAVAAGCGGTRTVVKTVTVERNRAPALSATGDLRLYGQIKSLARDGNGYDLRFDPAWLTTGVTANVAQAEDQGASCRPRACPPVPNDNYRIDESHRLLTFIVPAGVRGTVLAKGGSGFRPTTITAGRLAQLVGGQSPLKLFEPLSTGVWILVHVDTVRTFAQQYFP
ncbi:MAG: hypothetical protein ACXVY8_03595 [Gaiellaceae bacterium]